VNKEAREVYALNERIVELARELIGIYGFSLLDDPERLGQLLEDKRGDCRHEIFLLCFAIREVSKKGAFPPVAELLADRERVETGFRENLGFSPYVAKWALEAIAAILSDAEAIEGELARRGHVEARKGFLRMVNAGIAKRPRTAPARKKALRNGLLLLGIALLFLGLYVRTTESRYPVQGEHRLLFLAHLSGPNAAMGHVRLKSAQLAADMINEQGGVKGRYIRIMGRDVPARADAASRVVRELLRERPVTGMISACNEDVCAELARIADEFELPLVSTESSRMSATMSSKERPRLYSFRTNIDNVSKGRIMAYFTANGLKRERIALLSLAYDTDASEIRDAFRASFADYPGEIVCDRNYTKRGGLDHATASEVLASGADCAVIADPTAEIAGVVQTLRAAGYRGAVLGTGYNESLRAAAGGALDNCWWIVPATPDDSRLMSFQTSYRDKYNETVGADDFAGTILAYDSVRWMADALYRAPGYQGEALRHAFLSTRNLGLSHATLSIDPRTHGPLNKAVALLYGSDGRTRFQRRFRQR
jgi:branched-chain amino acid transport system substrate-binding protein